MDCNVGVKGEGFECIFGRGKGLVSIRYNGVQLLDDTVRPNFWRAPTNNDEAVQSRLHFAFWKTAGLYARCDNLTAETRDVSSSPAQTTLPDGQTLPIDFAIDGAGRCDITMTWQGTRTERRSVCSSRCVGSDGSLYLGLGPRGHRRPHCGRQSGCVETTTSGRILPNTPVYPQECGSRTGGVYSATVTGSGLNIGIGFAGDGADLLALPYAP